jgi:myo-inositol-1(or 4)-monophosphatase
LALDPLYLATAVEGALACGRVHRRYFRQHVEIHKKGVIDLVTAADLAAERLFRELIAARFADHAVIGEETAITDAERAARFQWIIDPVDGTTNFAHGLALFCVSIALVVDGRLELGVIYDPIAEELFTAERGQGARLNGVRLAVTSTPALVDSVLCTGFPYTIRETRGRQVEVFAAFLAEARAVRRLGSAALDLAYVACGRFDGFWEEHLKPWDMAAGALLIEEAGGRVTAVDGAPYDPFGFSIAASNGHIHDLLVGVILDVRRSPGKEA